MTFLPVPYSSGRKPCEVVASPMAVPALICSGVTPGSLALSCLAVVRTSSQLFGCHVPGRPARRKSCLLKYSTRPSVPTGTPYCLPPTWVMQAMALRIWAQPSQPSTTDHTTWSSGHPLLEVGDGEVRDPARLDVVLDAVSDLPEPTGRKPGNSPRLTTSPARQV